MLREQLQKLFPDHKEEVLAEESSSNIWLQDEPLLCKYEKLIIQGDYRDKIMVFLKGKGFKVKRVGG